MNRQAGRDETQFRGETRVSRESRSAWPMRIWEKNFHTHARYRYARVGGVRPSIVDSGFGQVGHVAKVGDVGIARANRTCPGLTGYARV